jgi:hypothetical protein
MASPLPTGVVPHPALARLRLRALVTLTVMVVSIAAITACERSMIEPVPAPMRPQAASRWATPGGADNSPAGGTGPTLAAPDTHSGSQAQASLPGYFKYLTIVQVTYSGSIHRSTLFGPFPDTTFGPMGSGSNNGIMWIGQSGPSGGGARPITALSEVATFQYTINYGRNPSSQPSNDNPACGNVYNWRDCVRFSEASPGSITYTPYSVDLTSTGDQPPVTYHGIAKFDIGAATPTINGFTVGVDAPEWLWTPDDTVKYGKPNPAPCGTAYTQHCEIYITHSGTMEARAYVNGTMKDAPRMHVTLKDSVYATASPPYGAANYTTTFTVTSTADTAWYFDSWGKFYPDAGGEMWITTCPAMWVTTRSQACGPWNVPSSGTAVFFVILHNNYRTTASTHVTVVPCPTKDSLLNDPDIRKKLDSLWRLSWPDTNNLTNRVERSAMIYKDATGKIVFEINSSYSNNTACSSTLPSPPPGATLLRYIHTHPARKDSFVQCDSKTSKRYADQFGKPSGDDWRALKDANDLTPGGGVIGWIIDQDEVLTFDPSGVNIAMVPQPSGDTAAVPTNWRTRNREYYKRRQPGCTLP